jgi:hypothetical protein
MSSFVVYSEEKPGKKLETILGGTTADITGPELKEGLLKKNKK